MPNPLDNYSIHDLRSQQAAEEEVIARAKQRVAAINDEFERRLKASMVEALAKTDKDSGTINDRIEGGLIDVKFVRSKRVKYDGKKLMEIASTMPFDRVMATFKIDFSVPETIYKALEAANPELKARIDEARTVDYSDKLTVDFAEPAA